MSTLMNDLKLHLPEITQGYKEQLINWYEHLHQYPEISYQEYKTTEYIRQELEKIGNYKIWQVMETGLIAEIEGAHVGNTVALRADIDALAMEERLDIPFKSKHVGSMHGCGHDSHVTMLLGVAKFLSEHKEQLAGKYRLLFQPAEEIPPGGALTYIEKGALDDVDFILGQHVMPFLRTGEFAFVNGPIMAASDTIHLKVIGKGGHASQPQWNIDPITTAAQIVSNFQLIISRETSPFDQVVISITNFNGGEGAHNVMPNEATLVGSVRTFNEEVRQYVAKRLGEIATSVAAANRCEVEYNFEFGYDATINDDYVTDVVRAEIQDRLGVEALPKIQALMAGEDFSRYLRKVPGTFYFTGIKNEEKGYTYPLHNGEFRVDVDVLPLGVEVMLRGALKLATLKK